MNINKVIGNINAMCMIFVKVFTRTNVHSAKYLPRIGTDNLAI